MGVFLLTYNPKQFLWKHRERDLHDFAQAGRRGGSVRGRWSVARKHGIGPGDTAYLLAQSAERRGIIAFGAVVSAPCSDRHYNEPGKMQDYVEMEWSQATRFTDPLPLWELMRVARGQHWTPQQSGVRLREEFEGAVAELWSKHVSRPRRQP